MKQLLLTIALCCYWTHTCSAKEIGEIRKVKLTLVDLPFSGDAIQANFIHADTGEIISFNHMDSLDKRYSLFDFSHRYRDSCREGQLPKLEEFDQYVNELY